MRKWTFDVVITEGSDSFWEGNDGSYKTPRGYATCEEVEELLITALNEYLYDHTYKVTIRKMENNE